MAVIAPGSKGSSRECGDAHTCVQGAAALRSGTWLQIPLPGPGVPSVLPLEALDRYSHCHSNRQAELHAVTQLPPHPTTPPWHFWVLWSSTEKGL